MHRRDFIHRAGRAALIAWSAQAMPRLRAVPPSPSATVPDLTGAMERAAQCCLAWIDASNEFFPWGGYEVAHDLGRWWNVMPAYEKATGFPIPPQIEQALLNNLERLTANPDALLINDPAIALLRGKRDRINLHNLREGLQSYTALIKYRESQWGRDQAHKLIGTIDHCLLPNGGLDTSKLQTLARVPLSPDKVQIQPADGTVWYDCSGSSGRAIEALVNHSEVTGDPYGLRVSQRIVDAVRRHLLSNDGTIRSEILAADHIGHNHSLQGTFRGVLAHALATDDRELTEQVRATYRLGVRRSLVSESGWSPHDLGMVRFPNDVGDPMAEEGSCSDAVFLALRLASRCGDLDAWDDVERLLRTRILPCQIIDSDDPRKRGGWGVHRTPHGRACIFDVFAAVLSVLLEVQQMASSRDERGTWLHLHLPMTSAFAVVQEARTDSIATLAVQAKQGGPLFIRIPGWVRPESIRATCAGRTLPTAVGSRYLQIPSAEVSTDLPVTISYQLPAKVSSERMPVSELEYQMKWPADTVVACSPTTEIWPRS